MPSNDQAGAIIPDTGSIRYPDASLVTSSNDIKIAFEVGFGQSLRSLFEVADEHLSAENVIVVLLLDVNEIGRGTLLGYPGELSDAEVKEKRMRRTLVAWILGYYRSQSVSVIGKLSIDLYL